MITIDQLTDFAPYLSDAKLDGKRDEILIEALTVTRAELSGTCDVDYLQAWDTNARKSLDVLIGYKARQIGFEIIDGVGSERAEGCHSKYASMRDKIKSGEIMLTADQTSGMRGKFRVI